MIVRSSSTLRKTSLARHIDYVKRVLEKGHSRRTERRTQEPKPRGKPPKKKSNRGRKPKGNIRERFGDSLHVATLANEGGTEGGGDSDELAAQPPLPPAAPRRRGRPPKQRPNPTFGGSLHVTAHADQGGTEDDNDGDELTTQPAAPPPAPRPRGRSLKQRPNNDSDELAARPPAPPPAPRPREPLLHRDPTPAAVKPQSRRLHFLRVYQHDTHGGARSWRHHRSARSRYTMLWMKKE